MEKKDKEKITQDEKIILKELLSNARKSAHEIAKKYGFSRQKVWGIIRDLEKDNFIWGYTAIIDESALDKNIFFALGRSKAGLSAKFEDVIDKIKTKKAYLEDVDVIGTFYLNGSYDWLTVFTAKNVIEAKKYLNYIRREYGDYLEIIELLESVFQLIKYGKINPNIHKLKEF